MPSQRTAVENWSANYQVAKYQPAKTLQWHAACSKKINEQYRRGNNLDGTFQRLGKPDNLYIYTEMEQQKVLYTHMYCEIKHIRRGRKLKDVK
ncbi:unnamed protein product [Onchocerca ochengi]|uniref:SCP domain-containing protein n=1 Tax=Onchocerca ochengi TaxID=42157 RepID=A0A182EC37_ONCOC|nr:unnamed protein product [Onchocerca ochengi]